jgi:hypothetical protein
MKRRHFLSMLGIGAASLAAAPLLKFAPKYVTVPVFEIYSTPTIQLADLQEMFSQTMRHDPAPVLVMHPRTYESLCRSAFCTSMVS